VDIALPPAEARARLERIVANGAEVVLFDALYENQLVIIGALIDANASGARPLFSVGSSGIEMALGAHWAATGELSPRVDWPKVGAVKPLLVVSGSCSPVTAEQIAWAESQGFAIVPFDELARGAAGA